MAENKKTGTVSVSRNGDEIKLGSLQVSWKLLAKDVLVGLFVLPAIVLPTSVLSLGNSLVLAGLLGAAILFGLLMIARHALSYVTITLERGGALCARDGVLFRQTIRLDTNEIKRIFCRQNSWVEGSRSKKYGDIRGDRITGAQLFAQSLDGRDHLLASGLLSQENAAALESEIEAFLQIRNVTMTGGH